MSSEKKERIFISYKRVDKERVFAIKDGIEQATGEKCWIDLDGIESNAQFAAKIMTAIDRCDVFLFMRSKEHNGIVNLETDWTYRELNYALAKDKNIVFINLDNSPIPDWVTFIFPHKQEVDSTDPKKIDRLHSDLIEWLGIEIETQCLSIDEYCNIAHNYYYGFNGVSQDYAKAAKYYRKAAELGDGDAQMRLGYCYTAGKGVEKDYTEAVKWFCKSAEQEYSYAQFNMGWAYEFGQGVEKNLAEAKKWYQKAAAQGHIQAQEQIKKLS